MPLGLGSALWAYIAPVQKTNLCTNPSFEYGTASAAAIESAGLGSSSTTQQFGAWSLFVTPTSNGTSGAVLGTWTATNLQDYSISAHAKLVNGVSYIFGASDPSGGNIDVLGTVNITGGGTWHWYSMRYTELVGGGARGVILRKASGANTGTYWADGIQAELGSVTTYTDGDQPGGTWQGAPHASTTFRTGQYRGGGSVIALADIGLQVDQMIGAGMPPIEVSTQSYAVIDGAEFQRQRAGLRQITLTAKPLVGTSLGDFHVTRRTLIDAFKPDLVTPQQPIRFLYVGGQGTIQMDAYYSSGLELGNMDGPIAENAGIQFGATDPYWYAPTQQGTTLSPRTALGSTNFIAKRSPLGVWGTIGSNGTTVQAGVGNVSVHSLAVNTGGTLFFGGRWGSVAGTTYPNVAMYYPNTNTFGTLLGGTIGNGANAGTIWSIVFNSDGVSFLGGDFNTAGGTALAGAVFWNGAFGSLIGGTLGYLTTDRVRSLLYMPTGTLFMGGSISSVGGTTARHLVFWDGANSGTAGSIGNEVMALSRGLDGRVFFGGQFSQAAGTTARFIGYYNGAIGTLSGGTLNDIVWALTTAPNGVEYIGGQFTTLSGASALRAVSWNGVGYTTTGQQLDGVVYSLLADQQSGIVYAGGKFGSSGAQGLTGGFAFYNGAGWLPTDIDLNASAGTVFAITQTPDRTIYIGGRFFGTAFAAAVGTVINTGRAAAYPVLRLRNRGAGTCTVSQINNLTTGNSVYFNYTMLSSEIATLTLAPTNRSFQSNVQGNVFGKIIPGSNLATWNLLPGTNYVSFLCDTDTLEAALYWQAPSWSVDGGTVA